jgi:hypothetical protein
MPGEHLGRTRDRVPRGLQQQLDDAQMYSLDAARAQEPLSGTERRREGISPEIIAEDRFWRKT